MGEETGKWVLIAYSFYSDRLPCSVYGLFDTEQEAMDYAEKYRADFDSFGVHPVLNAFYEEW